MSDMSETVSHTKGKWEVHEHNHIDGEFWCSIGIKGFGPITDIVGEEGNKAEYFQPVAGMKYLVTPVEEQKANAHRIVHCVNNFDALLEALKKYGAHERGCPYFHPIMPTPETKCNCGLDQAIKQAGGQGE